MHLYSARYGSHLLEGTHGIFIWRRVPASVPEGKKLLCIVVNKCRIWKSHVVFFCSVEDYSTYPKWHVLTTLCFVGVWDHQMLCFSSNLGSATWLVNTARPSTEYISSKWTFIFYSSKSTLNVSCSVNSSSCSHSRSVALDHGEHQLSPSKHQTSKSHMLCSVSSLPHLLLIFKPLCNPAPLQLLSCCIPWPTVHWNDFSVTSSRQTESVRPVLLWTIPSHLPEVFARLNRISGFTTELNFWSFS